MTRLLSNVHMRQEWQNLGLIADMEMGIGSGNRDASFQANMTSSTFQILEKVSQHHDPMLVQQFTHISRDHGGLP